MKEIIKPTVIILVSVLLFLFSCTGCGNRDERRNAEEDEELQDSSNLNDSDRQIKKVVFYIENSESMFGYVNGFNEYVDVISDLAEKPEFVDEKTIRDFYFVNGGDELSITPIGNDPSVLKTKLNTIGFKCGDITKSNLNSMFQAALATAGKDTISVLISDAIYDIGKPQAPLNALITEGKETRSRFIERLGEGDIQTIIIKLHSHFDGYYFPVAGGAVKIEQIRPYYIWIFGETELLNKYFSESYINTLKGYSDMARFLKYEGVKIPYQAVNQNKLGSFRLDRYVKNKLIDVESDRNGEGFQFTIAVDFSSLPFSDSYLTQIKNYSCNSDFEVICITNVTKKIYEVTSFTPTHLISVYTDNNPYCELELALNNTPPNWIIETSTEDESNIETDYTHTFGFKFLTDAISEAYEYKNGEKNIMSLKFEITK